MQARASANVLRSRALENFLDIGAKVEVNPDEVEVVKKKSKKTRLLRKDEKKALLDMLSDLASNSSDVISAVINIVTKKDHDHVFIAKCPIIYVNFDQGTN